MNNSQTRQLSPKSKSRSLYICFRERKNCTSSVAKEQTDFPKCLDKFNQSSCTMLNEASTHTHSFFQPCPDSFSAGRQAKFLTEVSQLGTHVALCWLQMAWLLSPSPMRTVQDSDWPLQCPIYHKA